MSDKKSDWTPVTKDSSSSNNQDPVNQNPQGLNRPVEEIKDVVEIDTGQINGPVVIFYGPRNVGKTVALIRLTSSLRKNTGFQVKVNKSFREDRGYDKVVEAFNSTLSETSYAPERTASINFLLLDVFNKGKIYCQVLEAPGEHFFDTDQPEANYPPYFQDILNENYKKVYVIFFEDRMFKDKKSRINYAQKVADLTQQFINPDRDKVIILFNKIDLHPELFVNGKVNSKTLQDYIYKTDAYNPLTNALKRNRHLSNVLFVPYSSGEFRAVPGKADRWIASNDVYPTQLWQSIRKNLDSSWKFW